MNKQGWVLERKFSESEITEVKAFHQRRLEQATAQEDKASMVAAGMMLKYFKNAGEWIGMAHYEEEANALEAEELFRKSEEYRLVKATFPAAAKGIWWGYEVVEEVEAK